MLGIGAGELVALLVVGLLLVGPQRLPQFSASMLRLVRQVRAFGDVAAQELKQAADPAVQHWQQVARLPSEVHASLTGEPESPPGSTVNHNQQQGAEVIGGDDTQGHAAMFGPTPLYLDAT